MVSGSNASVQIRTMMIKAEHTDVAVPTMLGTQGSDDLASLAIVGMIDLFKLLEHLLCQRMFSEMSIEDGRSSEVPDSRIGTRPKLVQAGDERRQTQCKH